MPPLTVKKLPKIGKNQENWKKKEKSGRIGKNWKGSFTLPLLTDRAGYATEWRLLLHHGGLYLVELILLGVYLSMQLNK